jgi:hypothetical protein
MSEEKVMESTAEELIPPRTNASTQKTNETLSTKPISKNIVKKEPPQESYKRIKPTYGYANKEKISETIRKAMPKEFIATNRFAKILGLIFLIIIIMGLSQFPLEKLLSGDSDITISIGEPWIFLEFGIMNPEAPPLKPTNFLLDLILYLIISYIIDICINFITNTSIIKSEKELMAKPKIYKSN